MSDSSVTEDRVSRQSDIYCRAAHVEISFCSCYIVALAQQLQSNIMPKYLTKSPFTPDLISSRTREISAYDEEVQLTQTAEALCADAVTLFRPTIRHEQFVVRADVLRKQGNQVDLIEVRSESFDSTPEDPGKNPHYLPPDAGVHGDLADCIRDIAFQYWVLRRTYPSWDIRCYVTVPDKATATCEHNRVDAQVEGLLGSVLQIPGVTGDFVSIAEQLADLRALDRAA